MSRNNLLFSLIAFSLLVYFVFSYYSIGDKAWVFFTSDNIYIPYFYQDLVLRSGSILQWKFSPVPYFFPDALIYFVIAFFTHHLKLAIVLFAMVQLVLYYWLMVAIGKMATKDNPILFHLSVITSIFLLAGGYLQQETLNYALVSQEHFGTALMFLLGMFLILRSFSFPNVLNGIGLFLICFLTTFSDIVFVTQFFATALITLFIMYFVSDHKKIVARNTLWISAGTVSAYILYRLRAFSLHITINPHLVRRSSLSELISATDKIRQNLTDFSQQNLLVVLFLCVFFFLGLIYLIKCFKNKTRDASFAFAVIFLFISMVTGYLSLLVADNDLMNAGYNGMRHSQPYILFPVFLGIPLFLTRYTNFAAVMSRFYGYFVLAIVVCAYLFIPHGSVASILNFYPTSISCLDQYAEKYHLQNGVANYWEAKSYSFLSKKNLNVVAIENNTKTQVLQPELWMNTLHDYQNREFTFLILQSGNWESADKEYVAKTFGAPQEIVECPAWASGGKDEIYIYRNDAINKWMGREMERPAYF